MQGSVEEDKQVLIEALNNYLKESCALENLFKTQLRDSQMSPDFGKKALESLDYHELLKEIDKRKQNLNLIKA